MLKSFLCQTPRGGRVPVGSVRAQEWQQFLKHEAGPASPRVIDGAGRELQDQVCSLLVWFVEPSAPVPIPGTCRALSRASLGSKPLHSAGSCTWCQIRAKSTFLSTCSLLFPCHSCSDLELTSTVVPLVPDRGSRRVEKSFPPFLLQN